MASLRNTVLALAVAAAHAAQDSDSQKPITQNHRSSGNPLNGDIAKFVAESLRTWHVPGMAVGVIDDDHIYTEVSKTQPQNPLPCHTL